MADYQSSRKQLEREVVKPILAAIKGMIRDFACGRTYKTGTYTSPANAPYAQFINDLKMPEHAGRPSLLLDRLGKDPDTKNRIDKILFVKVGGKMHKWIINTCGSGKTRISMEGMHGRFGFWLTSAKDESGLGSTDLHALVNTQLDDVVRNIDPHLSLEEQNGIFDTNRAIVKRRFAALLLARAYIMRDFLQQASRATPSKKLTQEHKRSWLLLQLYPVFAPSKPPRPGSAQSRILQTDIFESLMVQIIQQEVNPVHLFAILRNVIQECVSLIGQSFSNERILVVLDESQVLLDEFAKSFKASKVGMTRPILREIVANLAHFLATWPNEFVVLGLGTGLSEQAIEEAILTVSGKVKNFETHSDIGAFDTVDAVQTYLRRYIPSEILESDSGRLLVQRCWEWLRGRHRFLANFLIELICANYQAPHTVFNEYVKGLTACRLRDAIDYTQREEPEASASQYEMPDMHPIIQPDGWRPKRLVNTFAQAVACYMMRGEVRIVTGTDEHRMITLGIARYSKGDGTTRQKLARIDEPLIFLAGLILFDIMVQAPDAITSIYQILASRLAEHSGPLNRNGFEEAVMFILWCFIFREPRRLGDVFNIIRGPPGLANERAVMVMLKWGPAGRLAVHTSAEAGPRPDVIKVTSNGKTKLEFTQELYYHTACSTLGIDISVPLFDNSDAKPCILQWAGHEVNVPVCFPPACYGPDSGAHMQIVGGKNDGALFTVFYQFKYRDSNLGDEEARNAIMSVTPAHLGETMLKARGKIKDAQAEVDSLRKHLKDGFKSIEGGTPPDDLFGEYHVLRVVAGRKDMRLERLDRETSTPKFQKELDDPHPFATLNTEFVDSILSEYEPRYELTKRKEGQDVISDNEDNEEDQPPAIASTSCAVNDQAPENVGEDAEYEEEDAEEQTDDSDSAGNDPAPENGQGTEDAGSDNEGMEDVPAIPSTSVAGDDQVTTTTTTRGSSKRSKQGTAAERAPKRRQNAAAAQASPPEGQRIMTRSRSRLQEAAASTTRRSARLVQRANATAGPSTSQASGTVPAKKPTTTTRKRSRSRR